MNKQKIVIAVVEIKNNHYQSIIERLSLENKKLIGYAPAVAGTLAKTNSLVPNKKTALSAVFLFGNLLPAPLLESVASTLARSAWLHRAGFRNANGSSIHLLAIPHFDSAGGFLVIRHFDESEAF